MDETGANQVDLSHVRLLSFFPSICSVTPDDTGHIHIFSLVSWPTCSCMQDSYTEARQCGCQGLGVSRRCRAVRPLAANCQVARLPDCPYGQYTALARVLLRHLFPLAMTVDEGRPPIRILSLDGGGVRGLSSLLILRELMARIAISRGEKFVRPCDCFELIMGTGTGGISALLLGRRRLSVDQAIEEYIRVAENAFKPKSTRTSRFFLRKTSLLDAAVLEDTLGNIVERITGDRHSRFADQCGPNTHQCHTAVLAATTQNADAPPYVFQSYSDGTRRASAFTICEVACATSSTGGLFSPFTLGKPPIRFTSAGAAGYNNPSEIAIRVETRLWPGRSPDCIVSLGTGLQRIISLDSKKSKLADACRALVENCEQAHDRLQYSLYEKDSTYFRFNVDRGLEETWDAQLEALFNVALCGAPPSCGNSGLRLR